MIEATCSACGTVNRIAEADVPVGAKFVTCSSCKSRVFLPAPAAKPAPSFASTIAKPVGPRPMSMPTPAIPKIPGPPKPAEIADLPAPKRQGPLAGMEASKPAPKSGLDIADLPAPKGPSSSKRSDAPFDLDDLLPAPKTASSISDLPAPKSKVPSALPRTTTAALPPRTTTTAGISDLPTPKARGPISDLPAPKARAVTPPVPMPVVAAPPIAPLELDIVDLPTPKDVTDLLTPKHGGIDLPAPKGFFDDLPQPARVQPGKQGSVDLPAPKGFFDDLPQPARTQASAPDLVAPKGFFDDLPQPARSQTPSLPAPKGFFDDLPDAKSPPATPAAATGARGVFDDLPEPTDHSAGDPLGSNDLDLSAPLELDRHGGADLDLGLASPTIPPPNKGDFADLDLSAPTALPPPQTHTGISIKATGKGATKTSGLQEALVTAKGGPAAEIRLDLEDPEGMPAAPGLITPARRDAAKKKAAAAEATAETRAKRAKRRKIVLGALVGLALVGSGGGFLYKRYDDKQKRQAEVAEHVAAARKQIHDANATHWTRAASEAGEALALDDHNVDAIGLQAEALLGGALDTGLGGAARIAAGRKKLADALEAGLTGTQLEGAQALGMIASNQAERAEKTLLGMVQREPKNGFWLLYLGWAQAAKGDPAAAVKSFDAALAADPKTKLPVLYARGKAKLQLVDLEGAKADFAAVLELAKDHIGAQVGLAATRPAAQSSVREADLLAILARKDIGAGDPRAVVQAWTLAADVARVDGRLDVARDRYHKALELSKLDVSALVGLARVELRDNKLAVAADLVQKALSQAPESPDAQLVAADLYIKQGKLNDAFAITQKLAARTPPLPNAQRASLMLVTGNVLEAQGKDEDAIAAWTEAAKLAGDTDLTAMMKAVTKLGELAKKASDLKDDKTAADYRARADQLLSSLADRAQEDAALSKALGVAYLGAEDATKAEHFLRRAVEMKGDDVETHLELAKALAKLQRTNDALEQLKAAQQIDPSRADIALEIARTLEDAGRDEEAMAAYLKLLSAKDPPVQARVRAGQFLARKGDIKTAAAQADAILAAEPDNSGGHYLRGEGMIAAGQLDKARIELSLATEADPEPQYLDAQGRAFEASANATTGGDTKYFDGALRAYERASQAAPQMFNPWARTGRIHIQRKEYTQAVVPLLAASKLDPKNIDVKFDMGIAYKNTGHPTEAAEWLVQAAAGKQDAETYWQLALLYQEANSPKLEGALREATSLAQAQETKTGTTILWLSSAYYTLGEAEYGLHNFPAAKAAFEKFIERNPQAGAQLTEARHLLNGELK
jgi:tetratricopeptide (TPR) repeat protein